VENYDFRSEDYLEGTAIFFNLGLSRAERFTLRILPAGSGILPLSLRPFLKNRAPTPDAEKDPEHS
jgi:hypothetical protein